MEAELIVPHYLIASTNTCHEICKYGSRPSTAEMEKHSTREKQKLAEGQSQIRKKLPASETKTVLRRTLSSDKKDQVFHTPRIIKQEVKNVKHTVSSLKKVDVAAKTKPGVAVKSSMTANSCPFPLKPSRDVKIVKEAGTSKIVQKKAFELPRASASLSSKPSIHRAASLDSKQKTLKAAPLKNRKKERKDETKPTKNEKVTEKTLYIIEPTSEEESLKTSGSHISLSSLSSPLQLPNEGEPPAAAASEEEDKDLSWKLDFWRAKDANLEPDDNVCRRLRFNKARLLKDSQNLQNDMERKSFTQKEVRDYDMNNNEQAESDKVTLKRQEEEKKDAQGLYNIVIKETASKLAEVKRSKVRALVGAFENVISLQESSKTFSHY